MSHSNLEIELEQRITGDRVEDVTMSFEVRSDSNGQVNHDRSAADSREEDLAREMDSDQENEARALISRYSDQNPPQDWGQGSAQHHFTLRGVLVGSVIGIVICFSNMYFGLQTGWVSGMAMPAALMGFTFFNAIKRYLPYAFTPVENVLVQTVAGAVGTMPLGCGFVGILPALEFLLSSDESGPLILGLGKLIVWSVGICFFGVVFAVPLRKQVLIREKLKFPSGTATALMIGVLHKEAPVASRVQGQDAGEVEQVTRKRLTRAHFDTHRPTETEQSHSIWDEEQADEIRPCTSKTEASRDIRLLLNALCGSAFYTLISYFIPQIRHVPVFGTTLAESWLWTLNPSPAYIAQGIIMGPATTLHMLFGAILGWAFLSPLAKSQSWAPGPVSEWQTGSRGWIVWTSLAIMLADSIVSIANLAFHPLYLRYRSPSSSSTAYTPLQPPSETQPDAPPNHLISGKLTYTLLALSILICILTFRYIFPPTPLYAILLSLVLALLLGIMGVRALGETDLNPVSGISKLTQLIFALVIPHTNRNAVVINLLAGAVSESGALQAGDMMQDLRTGQILGASPKAQFYGQMIGSLVGAVASAVVYRLYTRVYQIPGDLFQVPTAYVWVFTARLVTGQGLPFMAGEFALAAGLIWAVLTGVRIWARTMWWRDFVPGGVAVAIGMYNTPNFTLARAVGGVGCWWWCRWKGRSETPAVVLASGLILGEGLVSIVNLGLASLQIPHL